MTDRAASGAEAAADVVKAELAQLKGVHVAVDDGNEIDVAASVTVRAERDGANEVEACNPPGQQPVESGQVLAYRPIDGYRDHVIIVACTDPAAASTLTALVTHHICVGPRRIATIHADHTVPSELHRPTPRGAVALTRNRRRRLETLLR